MTTETSVSLNLLIIEDSADDAQLVIHELERGGFDVEPTRVESEESLRNCLTEKTWDVVISDYSMPRFDGLRAAEMVSEVTPDTPFIFVSGVIGQERAVEAMRAGVRDYLPKDDLARLSAAVERELQSARERKRAKESAEAARVFAESVVRAMPTPLATLDGSRRVISTNPAFSAIFVPDDGPMNRPLGELCPALGASDDISRIVSRVLEDGVEAREIDVELQLGDDTRHFLVSARRLPTIQMVGPDLMLLMFEDVTHRRRILEQMMSAQRIETVGRLAGGIAHDFNNMLTVVQSFASFLLDSRYSADYTPREVGEIILDVTDRAARLTSQLLAFGRKQFQRLERANANDVVEGVREMIERLLGENVELVFELDRNVGVVRADLAHLEQSLLNLVLNARDALPQGGTIRIATFNVDVSEADDAPAGPGNPSIPAGEWVVLSVRDDGAGMDAGTQAQIFDPFFSTKEFGQGSGLGLSTVYGSIRQMGGHVKIESTTDEGTTVELFLPRVDDAAPQVLEEATSEAVALSKRTTILLVEDDELVREATRRILERHDFDVIPADSGDEALDLVRVGGMRIDVLVSDVMMPGISGVELSRELLGRPEHSELVVVLTSGYSSEKVFDPEEFGGRAEYLQKPFLPNDLVEVIRRLHGAFHDTR